MDALGFPLKFIGEPLEFLGDERVGSALRNPAAVLGLAEEILLSGHGPGLFGVDFFKRVWVASVQEIRCAANNAYPDLQFRTSYREVCRRGRSLAPLPWD
jgi:hypothetical protein